MPMLETRRLHIFSTPLGACGLFIAVIQQLLPRIVEKSEKPSPLIVSHCFLGRQFHQNYDTAAKNMDKFNGFGLFVLKTLMSDIFCFFG